MNPLEIHKHVAQSSGREVGEISPLAAELTELANQAEKNGTETPQAASGVEHEVQLQEAEWRAEAAARRAEAAARREAAIEHAQSGLDELKDYLRRHGLGMNALAARVGDIEIRYDEEVGEASITRTDGEPMKLFLPNDQLSGILPLPPELNIAVLSCEGGGLEGISCFPETLKVVNCRKNVLTDLPPLPDSLTELRCDHNRLTALPPLPEGLITLSCQVNKVAALPDLPDSLEYLYCGINELTSMPELPPDLEKLYAGANLFTQEQKDAIRTRLPGAEV
jgi:hypothetical protein